MQDLALGYVRAVGESQMETQIGCLVHEYAYLDELIPRIAGGSPSDLIDHTRRLQSLAFACKDGTQPLKH
jgi:hypothetical protein